MKKKKSLDFFLFFSQTRVFYFSWWFFLLPSSVLLLLPLSLLSAHKYSPLLPLSFCNSPPPSGVHALPLRP